MKRRLISMLVVLALSLAVCLMSLLAICSAANEIEAMRTETLKLVEAGDLDRAGERIAQMAEAWKRHEPLLEAIAPHETLHAVTQLIVESDANLESRDLDDLNRSMKLLGLAIEHLYLDERFRLENIL